MVHIYTAFAYVYDRLIGDIDYKKWADYIEEIFRRNGLKPSLVLDLGCGTGSFCIEMAERGYEMIGIDLSVDMLSLAKEKSYKRKLDILSLNQDMSNFELYGTVDAVVCLLDSINYITGKRNIKRLFRLVHNYLNPGGLFIFDVNSCYKFENILADNVFYGIDDDLTYIWQNSYDKKRRICEFDLTFFIKENEFYRRYDELHYERAYSIEEIRGLISYSGMELVNMYDNLSFLPPKANSERIFTVCRKKK